MANNAKQLESRDVRIQASPELWAAWDKWERQQGCPNRPEAFRLAMRQVTQFNPNCQEKNLSSESDIGTDSQISQPEPTAEALREQ